MRLFIAINLNEETKNKLLSLCDELRNSSVQGKFSLPENLHLTLAFLGECDNKQTADIKAVMDSTVFQQFELIMDCIGRFKRNGGDLWWAGVRSNVILLELQRTLTTGLCQKGFALDQRKYSPHITLGREVTTDMNPRQIPQFAETVLSIDLMKSERIKGILTYTAIYTKKAST